jgi:hypothetical protein
MYELEKIHKLDELVQYVIDLDINEELEFTKC